MFPAMGRSFQSLLDYEEEDFEENFGLNFTVSLCVCVCLTVWPGGEVVCALGS